MCQVEFRRQYLLFGCLLVPVSACRTDAKGSSFEHVTLIASSEVQGTTEPCGCTSDPLGDVARIASLANDHAILLDAGGLLYDPESRSPALKQQADAKAAALAAIYAMAEVGLGPADLAGGSARLSPLRHAANVQNIPTRAPKILQIGSAKLGIFGVVSPERVQSSGIKAVDPAPAAREAIEHLRRSGAHLVVALLGMSRAEARALLSAAPGIDFGIVGAEVGDGMPEAEPVGKGFLVAPADKGQRVVRIDLFFKNGNAAFMPFAGEATRRRALARTEARLTSLASQIAGWKRDPDADPQFLAARTAELASLENERQRLLRDKPKAPERSYFTYELVPVRSAIPREPKVAERLRDLDRTIGRMNFAAASAIAPPPPEPGAPTFVGRSACEKCHKRAVEFWQHTVHAAAWKTLTEREKQYNYECTGCHVTGWLRPGGSHLASVEKMGLTDVQCEVCHGPGSRHLEEAGLEQPTSMIRRPADSFCADNCHTKEHSDTFQLVPYLRDVVGRGHGEAFAKRLGSGITAKELRRGAIAASKK
jgi:hypothetical protein